MVKYYDKINDNLRDWALKQPLFFVASAPWTGKHINVSPKGLPSSTFTITGPNSCSYVDKTGSGSETIAHIYENKRVVIMFCSFDTLPRIMRFWCWGSVVEWDSPQFEPALVAMGQTRHSIPGARAIIKLDVWKVGTSCGTGVPILAMQQEQTFDEVMQQMQSDTLDEGAKKRAAAAAAAKEKGKVEFPVGVLAGEVLKDRHTLSKWADKMSSSGKLEPYQRDNNAWSLDGCTGIKAARRSRGQKVLLLVDAAVWARRVLVGEWEAVLVGILIGMVLMAAGRMTELIRT